MRGIPDAYWSLSNQKLLDAYRAGDTTALVALIERHDGVPPLANPPADVPPALLWMDIVAGRIDPFTEFTDEECNP